MRPLAVGMRKAGFLGGAGPLEPLPPPPPPEGLPPEVDEEEPEDEEDEFFLFLPAAVSKRDQFYYEMQHKEVEEEKVLGFSHLLRPLYSSRPWAWDPACGRRDQLPHWRRWRGRNHPRTAGSGEGPECSWSAPRLSIEGSSLRG